MPIPFVKVLQALLPTYQLKRLRNYMNVASRVAKKVIDAQTEAYLRRKEGGKDIMSILSKSIWLLWLCWTNPHMAVRANLSENPRNKLSENTLVAQMTYVLCLSICLVKPAIGRLCLLVMRLLHPL